MVRSDSCVFSVQWKSTAEWIHGSSMSRIFYLRIDPRELFVLPLGSIAYDTKARWCCSLHHDVFEESVVDATNAFKSEAKRWSQTDNRPSAPSASADSATRTSAPHSFRNLHMYLYMYMLLFVCDWTGVFFIVCKRRFNPEFFLFLRPVCRGLVLRPAFRCHACLDLA